ncbi:hypothetical protein EYF80_010559 [Liparis tanakae]|uniref:Uncharacterized protein n=1 Tax=Liparis tanakae TaxID=230148 RepID=A0A4Z2IPD3_9TELE|nr:hypothetical protein EYF80_010559 [Liparis tanakae]
MCRSPSLFLFTIRELSPKDLSNPRCGELSVLVTHFPVQRSSLGRFTLNLTVLFTKAAGRQAEQGPGPQHFHLTLSPITTMYVNDTTKETKS